MPGWDVTPVEQLKQGLRCPECQLLLRDPVQTEEGDRLCSSCYDAIKRTGVSKSGIVLGEDACYPDRAVGKEIRQLRVLCTNHASGCPWQGKLQDLEKHVCNYEPELCSNEGCGQMIARPDLENHVKNKCDYRTVACQYCNKKTIFHQLEGHYEECAEYPVKCERCSVSVKKSLLEEHHDKYCPYVECLCGELVSRSSLESHYKEGNALYKHMKAIHASHRAVIRAQKYLRLKHEEQLKLSQSNSTVPGEMVRVENELKKSQTRLDSRLAILEGKLNALEPVKRDVEASRSDLTQLRATSRGLQDKVDKQEDKLQRMEGQVVAVAKGRPSSAASRYTENYSESRTMMMEKKYEDLERQISMLKVHVSELELQLQASLASTHNGSFLWRIPDVARRRKDAIEERITSIYSPPFYTGRNGYKMCIRAYLNGDGIGFKSHLSLFFVMMRGEYDPLLKWPFEHKVSLILVDQEHRKHIVQTFKPTPESSSFRRPTSDMNVASGCPQFSNVSVLDEKNYVKDDIMYIKCIVDVSRIFHP